HAVHTTARSPALFLVPTGVPHWRWQASLLVHWKRLGLRAPGGIEECRDGSGCATLFEGCRASASESQNAPSHPEPFATSGAVYVRCYGHGRCRPKCSRLPPAMTPVGTFPL